MGTETSEMSEGRSSGCGGAAAGSVGGVPVLMMRTAGEVCGLHGGGTGTSGLIQ